MAQAVQAIGRQTAEGNEHTMTDAKDKIPVQRDRFETWYYEQENHSLRAERMAMSYAEAKAAFDAGWNAAQPAEAQPEPNMRHPKIQALIGKNARQHIWMMLVEQLVEDPHFETTAMDMEYWDTLHDKLKEKLTAAPPAPAAVPPGYALVPIEPTPKMVAAYLNANDEYWKRADELPPSLFKWRNGTPKDATVESYRAMIAAAGDKP